MKMGPKANITGKPQDNCNTICLFLDSKIIAKRSPDGEAMAVLMSSMHGPD